jgi:hypothetical protein
MADDRDTKNINAVIGSLPKKTQGRIAKRGEELIEREEGRLSNPFAPTAYRQDHTVK